MKKYKIRVVGKKHPICKGEGNERSLFRYVKPDPTIDKEIKRYWHLWRLSPCHKAILVLRKNKIVAFFRFYLYRDGAFYDGGTWVSKKHRGHGLGMMMWEKALKKFKPSKVDVFAASKAGLFLIKKVKENFSGIKFNIKK